MDQMLAHLRHELRTPFNQILGYTTILLEDAKEGGFSAVTPALAGIQTRGRVLLERIQAALSDSDDGVSLELDSGQSLQLSRVTSIAPPQVAGTGTTTAPKAA